MTANEINIISSFLSAIIGAGIGGYATLKAVDNQIKKEKESKNEIYKTMLHKDLIYLKDRIVEYEELSNDKVDHFYRIRYLTITENWREIITDLYNAEILNDNNISFLYDFFTDLKYIDDKYQEIIELKHEKYEKMGKESERITKKYTKLNSNIEKLNNIINKLS